MNLRVPKNPWRLMLAVNVAVLFGVFLHKISLPPYVPYIHLLVDYHFGFTKRALVGAVVSVFFSKIPVWLVLAVSGAVWLVPLRLFVQLVRLQLVIVGARVTRQSVRSHRMCRAGSAARLGPIS